MSAQQNYELRLAETREGISLSPCELASTIKAVKALLQKGQSFEAICSSGNPRIKVSSRTLYRYAEAGVFGLANIDLPKKVKYKPRAHRYRIERPVDRKGRSYSDFLDLPDEVRTRAVQMDTVIGVIGDFIQGWREHGQKLQRNVCAIAKYAMVCTKTQRTLWQTP